MAVPKFSPVAPTDRARGYASPDRVPGNWMPDRPAEIAGFQPSGPRRGHHGPDQGFALRIAARLAPQIRLQPGEHLDDAVCGCLGIALGRASLFSRAPVVHDVKLAFTIWGYFDEQPPAELIELRAKLFAGLRHVAHHYTEARDVADMVPDSTLQLTPEAAAAKYPGSWRELVGA
ncbi:MAG: hypothetical protein O3B90_11190 [Actinomycetota bacterium]|jgi:hypothetical protein|uniref:hypothetical protein n=1 Tax=uncultured Ilumatobacter sp. TaxID=879968 RepID=UPI00374E7D56|nr:hypothetical protein [Actinomycetota bacterium]